MPPHLDNEIHVFRLHVNLLASIVLLAGIVLPAGIVTTRWYRTTRWHRTAAALGRGTRFLTFTFPCSTTRYMPDTSHVNPVAGIVLPAGIVLLAGIVLPASIVLLQTSEGDQFLHFVFSCSTIRYVPDTFARQSGRWHRTAIVLPADLHTKACKHSELVHYGGYCSYFFDKPVHARYFAC